MLTDVIELLNGAPLNWLESDGISLTDLPTHFGKANIKMRYNNKQLVVDIQAEFDDLKDIKLYWPIDAKPKSLMIDGKQINSFQEDSVILPVNTKKVVASW